MDIEQARQTLEAEIRGLGYEILYRKNLTGKVTLRRVFIKSRNGLVELRRIQQCAIPYASTRKSLYIVAHELYHCLYPRYSKKVYINEMKAEQFAHEKLRELGFAVPHSMTQRAKNYVAWKLSKARRRGLKKIDSTVKQWIKP